MSAKTIIVDFALSPPQEITGTLWDSSPVSPLPHPSRIDLFVASRLLIQSLYPDNDYIWATHSKRPVLLDNCHERIDTHLSISHHPEMIFAASSNCPIGVDIEKIRDIPARFFARPEEVNRLNITPLELWVLKEALYKSLPDIAQPHSIRLLQLERDGDSFRSNYQGYQRYLRLYHYESFVLGVSCGLFGEKTHG
jgi:hypothetical protein